MLYLPVISLVVRRDDEIVDIYPACDGERHHSVEDALDRLADGEDVANL